MDDWQPGDLALCVRGFEVAIGVFSGCIQDGPRKGCIYTVERIKSFPKYFACVGLSLSGYFGFFAADNFRKLRPHTPDAEDIRTIELLNGKREPVDAVHDFQPCWRFRLAIASKAVRYGH